MPAREPSLADLAKMLGISQLAAQRHATASGGAAAFSRRVMNAINHVLAGGSTKTLGGLPKEIGDAIGKATGKAVPTFKTEPRTVGSRLNQPPTKEEESEWSDEYLVPSSSNVYSYQYFRQAGAATGTLFVTFRAVNLRSSGVSSGEVTHKGRKSRSQLIGQAGKTVASGARPFVPGVKYQYLRVEPRVFLKLKDSHSKGGAVWDLLRVRGTVFGAKYSYQVASAQVTPGIGEYLPRKATRSGFKTRTLADFGTGQRGFVTSTLPASNNGSGFRTRNRPGR